MLYLENAANRGKRIGKSVVKGVRWTGWFVDTSIRENHEWMNYIQYLIIMAAIGSEARSIHARLDEIDNKIDSPI